VKPVTQTEIGVDNPRANCLMAAVASILEVPIELLPDVYEYETKGFHWWEPLRDALRPFGLVPMTWSVSGEEFPQIAPPGYSIACGMSPRSDKKHLHAVVALDGKIVHDPHPTRGGLVGEPTSWIILIPRAAA
jgi:hypothetical protein